jgi:broad specificity phosphatase PhoE
MQGRTDIDLSEQGKADAAELASSVARWDPKTLIVSPLARARTTARLLTDLPPLVDDAWTEHSLGDWEGKTPDGIGADYARWRAGEIVPPGGEPVAEIRARVGAAVSRAVQHPGPVLVVTHGGTIRAVLASLVGLTPAQVGPVAAPSLTVLDVSGASSARLRQLNLGV